MIQDRTLFKVEESKRIPSLAFAAFERLNAQEFNVAARNPKKLVSLPKRVINVFSPSS
jgi:hypothetical protein